MLGVGGVELGEHGEGVATSFNQLCLSLCGAGGWIAWWVVWAGAFVCWGGPEGGVGGVVWGGCGVVVWQWW